MNTLRLFATASLFGLSVCAAPAAIAAALQSTPEQPSGPSTAGPIASGQAEGQPPLNPPPAGTAGAVAATPAADTGGFSDIIVTARRVEENLQRVPVAVVALSADTLQRRNVTAVNDIQFSVPNLQIKPSNTYASQPEFIIRGQRQVLFTDENVVTYVNGVAQSTRGLQLYDLDSVQALKGPQGTLFGKNSMGGAMVFTTARPKFQPEAKMTLELGNYHRVQGTVMANVPLVEDKIALRIAGNIERQRGFFKNLNPGFKDLDNRHDESGRVSLLIKPDSRFESTTVFDYLHRNEIPIPSEIEAAPLANNFFRSVTQQGVTIQSALGGSTPVIDDRGTSDPSDDLLVRRGNPFRTVAQTGFGATLPGRFPALSTYAARSSIYGVANSTSYEFSDAISLKNIFGYRHEVAYDYQDPSGLTGMKFDLGALFGVPPGFVIGQATNNDTYYKSTLKQYSDELQLIGKLTDLNFIAGLYYSHSDLGYRVNSSFVVGPASFYGPLFDRHGQMDSTARSAAAFAQGTYDFSGIGIDGLRLTAGVRYSNIKKKANITNFYSTSTAAEQTYGGVACNLLNGSVKGAESVSNSTTCLLRNNRTYKAVTWTGSLEYQATPHTLLYFASRRGFKAGSPDASTRVLQYSTFGAERITDFELGIKHQGEIGTVPYRINVAGFIGKYKDIQTQDIIQFCSNPAANPANGTACGAYTDLIVFNVGQATIKGVEVEASVKPIRPLELNVGYSYQVGRYGKGSVVPQPTNPALPVADSNPINFTGGTDLSHLEFAGVPRTNLNVSATLAMDFIPDSFARTSLSGNFYYRSSTKGLAVQAIFETPSFQTVGARLTFDALFESNFSLAFWGSNLTNERYKLFCSNNLNSIGYAACKWGDPRTYGMTISAKF